MLNHLKLVFNQIDEKRMQTKLEINKVSRFKPNWLARDRKGQTLIHYEIAQINFTTLFLIS